MQDTNIYILGDICPRFGNSEQFQSCNAQNVFHEIQKQFLDASLVIGNLECPITKLDNKLVKNSINLKALPSDVKVLAEAGINGLALANNHILDYGINGLVDTINAVREHGMFCYGAGNLKDAEKLTIILIGNKKIGILAFAEREFNCAIDYNMGANLWDDLKGIRDIREAKQICDYLIIQYHGGIEAYKYPSPRLRKRCRAMAEAGADLVTCQHSHCIGTRERWNNCEIIYGQGNTIFGYEKNNRDWNEGLIIKVVLKEQVEVSYVPIVARNDGEHLMKDVDAQNLLYQFNLRSQKLNDDAYIEQKWIDFCKKNKNAYLPMLFSWGRIANKLNRITNGKMISTLTKRRNRNTSMNLIRCDSHREVLETILKADYDTWSEGT